VRRYGEMVRNLGIARTDPDWYEYVLTDAGRDL